MLERLFSVSQGRPRGLSSFQVLPGEDALTHCNRQVEDDLPPEHLYVVISLHSLPRCPTAEPTPVTGFIGMLQWNCEEQMGVKNWCKVRKLC